MKHWVGELLAVGLCMGEGTCVLQPVREGGETVDEGARMRSF